MPDPNPLNGVECPACGAIAKQVSDTRRSTFVERQVVRRKRTCSECSLGFFTVEVPEKAFDEIVTDILRTRMEKIIADLIETL